MACVVLAATPALAADAHPLIPGFERFYTVEGADLAEGGRLLLGELNCTSCHRGGANVDSRVLRKPAPILDGVGSRVNPAYLRRFLASPHAVKPGTTMPDLLAATPEAERQEQVEALVQFLAATGKVSHKPVDRKLASAGNALFHKVGCVACHGARTAQAPVLATSIPLGQLSEKYSIPGLTTFLQDPLKVRPGGRMPGLNLSGDEARNVAHYLLEDLQPPEQAANLNFAYYEGSWNELPKFDGLTPKAKGQSAGFDVGLAQRTNDFAMTFDGFLKIDREGDYTFHVTSDDGSHLALDGKLAVNNDGIHAPSEKSASVRLTAGMHPLHVAVFNGGGGVELQVEIEGPGLPRQPAANFVQMTANPAPIKPPADSAAAEPAAFTLNPALAARGAELFATVGCANCHQLQEKQHPIASKLSARSLAELKSAGGCMAAAAVRGLPHYDLNAAQQASLASALQAGFPDAAPPEPQVVLSHVLTTFNCYTCHQRDGKGGPEEARNALFETTQKEMGDEGRLPPPLNGVGAKLTTNWFKHVMNNGAKDRPYMLTRMPRFGESNVGAAIPAFEALDKLEPVPAVEFSDPLRHVKAMGRFMVGDKAFGCIKCHNFRGIQATGVQALDLTTMTTRLRRDWFHQYIVNPQEFRPGTRMPSAWPFGVSQLKTVLDGDTPRQIEAVWLYLSDGGSAGVPEGLARDPVELVADKEAVMYRNFIEGAGPRAIGVGYPEHANLAFDANDLRLALIWQGKFIDASRHWTGRGEGFQPALGDNLLRLPAGPNFAQLESDPSPWPTQPGKALGEKFRGYRLTADGRPTFLYELAGVRVEDFSTAIGPTAGSKFPTLKRTLILSGDAERVWYRAAAGRTIDSKGHGTFLIDGEWTTRIESSVAPVVWSSDGKAELRVPVKFIGGQAWIVQEFIW